MARDVFEVVDELGKGLAELRRMLAPLASLTGRGGPHRRGP